MGSKRKEIEAAESSSGKFRSLISNWVQLNGGGVDQEFSDHEFSDHDEKNSGSESEQELKTEKSKKQKVEIVNGYNPEEGKLAALIWKMHPICLRDEIRRVIGKGKIPKTI